MAATTILGGISNEVTLLDIMTLLPRTHLLTDTKKHYIALKLNDLYPLGNGVNALRPDLLGEAHFLSEYEEQPEFLDKMLEHTLSRRNSQHILSFLERIIKKQGHDVYAIQPDTQSLHGIINKLFKRLRPVTSGILENTLNRRYGGANDTLQKFSIYVLASLEDLGISASARGNFQLVYSVYQSMKLNNSSFADVFDALEMIIQVDSVEDCYRALGAVHRTHRPLPKQLKDYIAVPGIDGYRGLHTVVLTPSVVPITVRIYNSEMVEHINTWGYNPDSLW